MRIEACRSADGRLRTARYPFGKGTRFCLAEETARGTLITEFGSDGEVLDQSCVAAKGADAALAEYLKGIGELGVSGSGLPYEPVGVKAACAKCGGAVVRELDLKAPREIGAVPVVPMFVCRNCKSRHYLLTDEYLRRLVQRRPGLFERGEIGEKEADERAFMNTLQEYVIRIFASKRISRLKLGN